MNGSIKSLRRDLYLAINLLEKIEHQLKGNRVFISSREKIHPCGLEIYDELQNEAKLLIESYQKTRLVSR